MSSGWYVRREGSEIGPISDVELRSLASEGHLSPEHLVWRKGLNEWTSAGAIKGLFPSSPGKGSGGAAEGAGPKKPDPLAVLQEEKARIQSASLPQAYAEFGKAFYDRVDHAAADAVPQELVPLIKQIDSLLSVLAQQTSPASSVDPSKPASQWATGSTMSKATEKEIRKKFAQLGKRAYDRGDHPASCKDECLTIRALSSRDAAITQQIEVLKQKAAAVAARKPGDDITAKTMQSLEDLGYRALDIGHGILFSTPVVCLLAVVVPPVGLLLIWRHPTWGKFSKIRWATISAVCFLSLLMIETTKHVAGTGLGVVAEGARAIGSGVYDFAASNGIVPPEKKPKWLAGSAKEWVEEPPLVQLDGGTPPTFPASKPADAKPSPAQAITFDAFRGEWKATLVEEFAIRMADGEIAQQDRRLYIDGPTLAMERTKDSQRGAYQGTFRFDPTTKAFDWSGTGPNGAAVEWVGIYDLSGDVLKLCYRQKRGSDSPQRPQTFQSDDEKPVALNFEYRRVSRQGQRASAQPSTVTATPPATAPAAAAPRDEVTPKPAEMPAAAAPSPANAVKPLAVSTPGGTSQLSRDQQKWIHSLIHIPPGGPGPDMRWISVDANEAKTLTAGGYWQTKDLIGYGAVDKQQNTVPLWRFLSAPDNRYQYALRESPKPRESGLLAWVWTQRSPGLIEVFVLENPGGIMQLVPDTERGPNGESKRDWLVSQNLFKQQFSFFVYPPNGK